MSAIISTELYPIGAQRTSTGLTTAVRELVEGALRQGADIRQVIRFRPLVTNAGLTLPRAQRAGSIDVLDVPRIGTRRRFSPRLTRLALSLAGTPAAADLVVCHTAASFALARQVLAAPGRRFVLVIHACDLGHRDLAAALARADAVYCRSEALRDQLFQRRGVQARGVLASGLPASEYGSADKTLVGPLRLVVAATMIPRRNIGPVIEVLALIRGQTEVHLDVFGDGPLLDDVRSTALRLGLAGCVSFHGFRPREEVLAAMRDAHLFLMPSVDETFGLAYLEAMAQGCVVIGHRGWGIDGIVMDGRNGYLVDAAEPTQIADRILAYLGADRAALHARSYRTACAHDADTAAAAYAAMIHDNLPVGDQAAAYRLPN